MTKDRKTIYVNDQPVSIFLWAEVQHCVNAYDSDLYLAVQRGEAEIVDEKGDRIGWGGFASEGQHIYVRLNPVVKDQKTIYVNDRPVQVSLSAEVQQCVNAYDNDLYLAVLRGAAEIADENGECIGWGGFAEDGQHIYVRYLPRNEDG
jgi:hypothetical protein